MPKLNTIKIATFNVNSVKSRLPILEAWFAQSPVDILCMQETKCQDHDFPVAFFEEHGYHVAYSGMKSYNGVAIASRVKPESVQFGFDDGGEPECARLAYAKFANITVLNTYVPQGKSMEHADFQYKLRFLERVKDTLQRHCKNSDNVLWLGDLNVAPSDMDVTNPNNKRDHVCFCHEIQEALADVMTWGLTDIYRQHRPDAGEFSFWDYRVKDALSRNIGWRIDHLLGTEALAELCVDAWTERSLRAMERPSDHTAVTGEFSL